MNKTRTRKRKLSSVDLLKNSFHTLFHPDSKEVLIDYSQLNFINFDELAFIDSSQLKLLHLPTLLFFFRYLGALTVFVLVLTVLGSAYLISNPNYKAYNASSASNKKPSILRDMQRQTVSVQSPVVVMQKNSKKAGVELKTKKGFEPTNALMPSQPVQKETQEFRKKSSTDQEKSKPPSEVQNDNKVSVTNSSKKTGPVVKGVSSACSFSSNGKFYSDDSDYKLNQKQSEFICAQYPNEAYVAKWIVSYETDNEEVTKVIKDPRLLPECMRLEGLKQGYVLQVDVFGDDGEYVDYCQLNFVK